MTSSANNTFPTETDEGGRQTFHIKEHLAILSKTTPNR